VTIPFGLMHSTLPIYDIGYKQVTILGALHIQQLDGIIIHRPNRDWGARLLMIAVRLGDGLWR
jgi:hypothetical protein